MRPSHLPIFLCLFSCGASQPPKPQQPQTRMGVHGMVLFGDKHRYMSHIPMFKRPHDAQLIFEVDVPGGPYADGLYTFEPERFDLDGLMRGERTSFKGTVFKGSFEDGGAPIAKDVSVSVKRVLDARYLQDGGDDAPKYLLFGEAQDAYLVRRIARAPGVDQIVRATVSGGLDDAGLARGVEVTLEGHGPAPLAQGESLRAMTPSSVVRLDTGAVLSCLVGPDFDKPCAR